MPVKKKNCVKTFNLNHKIYFKKPTKLVLNNSTLKERKKKNQIQKVIFLYQKRNPNYFVFPTFLISLEFFPSWQNYSPVCFCFCTHHNIKSLFIYLFFIFFVFWGVLVSMDSSSRTNIIAPLSCLLAPSSLFLSLLP